MQALIDEYMAGLEPIRGRIAQLRQRRGAVEPCTDEWKRLTLRMQGLNTMRTEMAATVKLMRRCAGCNRR